MLRWGQGAFVCYGKAADRSFAFTPVRRLKSELVLLVVLVLSLRLFLVLGVILIILVLAILVILAVLAVLVVLLVLHKAHLTFAEGRMCCLWKLYAVKIWELSQPVPTSSHLQPSSVR